MSELLRVYFDPREIGEDGYPYAWHGKRRVMASTAYSAPVEVEFGPPVAIKNLIRDMRGNRCERCGHPYERGAGEWSPCDEQCHHGGPVRTDYDDYQGTGGARSWTEAQWRVLTVHHLNGVKYDCRWQNLVALCQRCHLNIQRRVVMEREFTYEHSDWFKVYAAAWYAEKYLGQDDLSRQEVEARLDELLALEQRYEQGRLV